MQEPKTAPTWHPEREGTTAPGTASSGTRHMVGFSGIWLLISSSAGELVKFQEVLRMIKQVLLAGIIVCVLIALASCTSGEGDPVKQRYTKDMPIRANEIRHPQYSSRVVGKVFIDMGLIATNQKRYSGEPPFQLLIGFHSLTPEITHIKILSLQIFVNDGNGIDIIGHLPALETDTDVSLSRADCGDCGYFGSKYLETDHFILAAPVDDDHVKIIIKIKVGPDHIGEVIFNFVPQVLSGTPRGLPA